MKTDNFALQLAVEQLKDSDGRRTKINIISFEAEAEDLKELRRIALGSGGNIREMK